MDVASAAVIGIVALVLLYKVVDRLLRLPRVGRYPDRYVFVTGCDSGFGYAAAKQLDALGCHVFAGCLTEAGEEQLIRDCSTRVQTVRLDIGKPESVRKAYEFVKSQLTPGKGLWGLVNNAGIGGKRGRVEWLHLEDYRSVNAVNLYGLIDVTTTFLPLIKLERGRIVNTSSMAGRIAIPDAIPYTVSKYGVEAFSDALRRSMRIYGLKVSLVEPGGYRTSINTDEAVKRGVTEAWNAAPEEARKEFGREYLENMIDSQLKIKQDDNPTEVADVYVEALFCRFPRARYVVGTQGRRAALVPPLPEWLGDWVLERVRHDANALPEVLRKKRN